MKALDRKEWLRAIVLGILLVICLVATRYFHSALKIEIVFTHLFYVPIILAGLWWSRKGIVVAVFLALMLLISHAISPLETPFRADIVRASMFVVVGTAVAVLNQKRLQLMDELKTYTKSLEFRVEEGVSEIKQMKEKQEAILNAIGDSVIVLDNELNVIWSNRIAMEQYRLVPGKKCYDAVKRIQEPCQGCIVMKTFEDGEVRSQEQDGIKEDGNRFSFIATCSPVRDVGGQVVSVVEVLCDITDRKGAEDEIRKLNEELEQRVAPPAQQNSKRRTPNLSA